MSRLRLGGMTSGVPTMGGGGATSITIPQYTTLTSTQREDFENVADWSVISGSTPAEDAVHYTTGIKSVRLTNAGANSNMQKTVSFSLAGDTPRVTLDVYKHSGTANASVFIYMAADAGFSKYMEKQIGIIAGTAPAGWYRLEASDFSLYGGITWNDTIIRLRVFVTGANTDVSFDNFCTNVETSRVPMAMFTIDDGYADLYTQAYPQFSPRSLHATAFIISNQIGAGGRVTSAQLLEMQGNGWTVANHTANHYTLTTQNEAEQTAEIEECRTDLVALGLTGGDHVAYPGGAYNATTRTVMASLGMLTGRTTAAGYNTIGVTPRDVLNGHGLNASVSLATAKGYVDTAVTNKTTVCFILHGIVTGTPTSLEWNVNDLAALIAYCRQQSVPLISIADYYQLLSQELTVPT